MSSDSVVVKQEPVDLKVEPENGSTVSSSEKNDSECVDIKMEIEVAIPDASIKSEPVEPTSPSSSRAGTWDVPITNETSILPEFVDVTVKEEAEDIDDDSALNDPTPDEEYFNADTSTGSGNIEHDQSAPTGPGFQCQICKKTFANSGNVQRHLQLHNRQTYKCNECGDQFLNQLRLDRHVFNTHTLPAERLFPCDICQKTFKTSSNLMQHKKVHLAEKPYKCPDCPRSFSFKTNLVKHQGKTRCKPPLDTDSLVCHVCNKVFEKEYLLKSHLRRHDSERPYSCDQCSTKFKYKSTLIRHLQLHNGVKPFSCPVCNKTFTTSGLLKPHMRVHTGEKPYPCPICSKNFTHKHNMQRHMLRHNKVKHLVCDVCHKEFPRESRLKYHMRTHVNEKHFICHVCPKRFSHKQNVIRHYTRKHPGQTYDCKDTDASVALKVWDSIKSKYYDDEAEVILG